MNRSFQCAGCGNTFAATWSPEEREAERKANGYENIPDEDMCIVCDTCYAVICVLNPRLVP